ncbi:MAG: hypothetical protein HFI87_06665 [Bacilli bacterium]|nr:hypothetical protein [Bacilli bacterium]
MGKYTCDGINFNTFKLLFETKSDATIDMQLSEGLYQADRLSYYQHTFINNIVYNLILNPIFYPNIHWHLNNTYTYTSKEEKFAFRLLDRYLNKIIKNNNYIKQNLLFEQKYCGRAGTCSYSIILACYLENSKLVIGNMPCKNGEKVLHRFVQVEHNGQNYILDIAKNLIMKKDDYYRISQFEELGTIDSTDLRAIYNFCLEARLCDHTAIISMFGKEILNELDNKKLIKERNTNIPNFSGLFE